MIPRIALSPPQFGERELPDVPTVMRNDALRGGPVVEEFENRFARAVGSRYAVAVSSGTAALFLAYRALLEPGAEVVVPDFTFVATASMVVAGGCHAVFADVHPETLTLDPQDVEDRLTKRTKAIVPVHLYGHPADVAALTPLAKRRGLKVIWDVAQAHGARFGEKDVGAFPDVVCYSFSPPNNMATTKGGMLTTLECGDCKRVSAAEVPRRGLRLLPHSARLQLQHDGPGSGCRPGELARLPSFVQKRLQNAEILRQSLEGVPGVQPPRVDRDATHVYTLFTLRLDRRVLRLSRNESQMALRQRGIEASVYYPTPLHRQPIFLASGDDSEFPVITAPAKLRSSLLFTPS